MRLPQSMKRCCRVGASTLLLTGAVCTEASQCPVTQGSSELSVAPYGLIGDWYGTEKLAVHLPSNRQWQVRQPGYLLSSKQFYWSVDDHDMDPADLTLDIREYFDGEVHAYVSRITNANTGAFNFLLAGIVVEGPGCWEVTARYRGETVIFIVETPVSTH